MKPVIIIGTGSFAELLYFYLKEYSGVTVIAFSINAKYMKMGENTFCGLPIVPFEKIEENYPSHNYDVMLGIGYSKMNTVREKLFQDSKAKGYFIASFVHPTAIISKDAVLGEGNIIMEGSIIQPFVNIGHANQIWCHVTIAHNNKIGNYNVMAGRASTAGYSIIGNNCFIGNNSTISDHVTIADFSLVGAAALVKRDTAPYSVVVPAKSIVLEGKRSTDFL